MTTSIYDMFFLPTHNLHFNDFADDLYSRKRLKKFAL